jgi:hypothetical protein
MTGSKMQADSILEMWVVTHNTKDFPGLYVVRVHEVGPGHTNPTDRHQTAPTLEAIRALVPEGKVKIERHPNDDPVIVETWL